MSWSDRWNKARPIVLAVLPTLFYITITTYSYGVQWTVTATFAALLGATSMLGYLIPRMPRRGQAVLVDSVGIECGMQINGKRCKWKALATHPSEVEPMIRTHVMQEHSPHEHLP